MPETRIDLSIPARPTPAGRFEILPITAGNGNGYQFNQQILRESLPLWNNVQAFIDHDANRARSVRDLCGILTNPRWDPTETGILCDFTTAGPAGQIIDNLGREILDNPDSPLQVGFSADMTIIYDSQKIVTKITKVFSVDIVYQPARGGKFTRVLNQQEGATPMATPNTASETTPPATSPQPAPTPTTDSADMAAIRQLLQVQQQQQALAAEAEAARATRAQMCGYLLEAGLNASKLPEPAQRRLRQQFANRVFEAAELTTAIEDARTLVSELTGPQTVIGPNRVTGMFNTEEQLQLAVDDLLGVPRTETNRTQRVHRLNGIRELYHLLTGDIELHGGYHADRVQLATTSDFTGLVKNALNKIVVNQWEALGRAGYDWWQKVATVEHFTSLNSVTGTLVGTVGTLPTVSEGAEYTELAVGDSPETGTFYKYGGYIPLTLELIDRDETRKLSAYARELASAGLRKISALVAAVFTDNSGIGPTLADTGALFNATAVTTAGGHANLLTSGLSSAQWETVSQAVYNQKLLIRNATGYYGTGPKMAVNPKYCLIPRALSLTARQIFGQPWDIGDNHHFNTTQQGEAEIIIVPEWTDADDWAAACDPTIAPAIYVGERFGLMPEVYIAGDELSPAVFTNDEHRMKVRQFLAVWVNDFRPLHKENV